MQGVSIAKNVEKKTFLGGHVILYLLVWDDGFKRR